MPALSEAREIFRLQCEGRSGTLFRETRAMTKEPYSLRLAVAEDIPALLVHGAREIQENGKHGIIFAPYEPEAPKPITDERIAQTAKAFAFTLSDPFWQRTWLLLYHSQNIPLASAAPAVIVGSLTLYGARLPSELHRCMLGMGIEHEHRAKGLGRWMLESAISWAKSQAELSWIDLGVFSGNVHAQKLYERLGFVVTGQREDAFRVMGQKITDISMSLALRSSTDRER